MKVRAIKKRFYSWFYPTGIHTLSMDLKDLFQPDYPKNISGFTRVDVAPDTYRAKHAIKIERLHSRYLICDRTYNPRRHSLESLMACAAIQKENYIVTTLKKYKLQVSGSQVLTDPIIGRQGFSSGSTDIQITLHRDLRGEVIQHSGGVFTITKDTMTIYLF